MSCIQPRNEDTDLGYVPSLSPTDPPVSLSWWLLRLLSSVGGLPQSEQKSQSPERRAGVMRLLFSGYAGKVRRKLVFPWILARNQWQASSAGNWDVPQVPGHPQVSRATSSFPKRWLLSESKSLVLCRDFVIL